MHKVVIYEYIVHSFSVESSNTGYHIIMLLKFLNNSMFNCNNSPAVMLQMIEAVV